MSLISRFRPLYDRILVQRVAAEVKTKSGILLPESAVEKLHEGTVIAVGPGARDQTGQIIPPSVVVGDTVLLPEYGGSKLVLDKEEYTLYRDAEILGKLEKKK